MVSESLVVPAAAVALVGQVEQAGGGEQLAEVPLAVHGQHARQESTEVR